MFGFFDHAFRDMSVADVGEVLGLTDRFLFGVFREKGGNHALEIGLYFADAAMSAAAAAKFYGFFLHCLFLLGVVAEF